MSAGFTPGPWHTEDDAKAYAPPCVCVMSGETILAEVLADDTLGVDAEVIATARLIAAAPDMFEALEAAKLFLGTLGGGPRAEVAAQVQAALGKARGEA